jgi:parvulin-like peptidyl-prolyl isomerase
MQGWISKGSLADSELDELLFSIDLNELSDIRETSKGYEIVRVLERTDAGYVPFENAQEEIRNQLLDEKRQAEYDRYLNDLRQRIPVEIFEPNVSLDPPK